MSETKQEIPAPMLDAVAKALYERGGYDYAMRDMLPFRPYWKEAQWQAEAALEAAGVDAMAARIAELEGELAQYQTSKFHPDWSLLATTQENLRESWARIRELEGDSRRLRFLMTDSGIDGFYGVFHDRHNFAIQAATERGHDEPTDEDEFDGWRRLIDAAMNASSGAGGE